MEMIDKVMLISILLMGTLIASTFIHESMYTKVCKESHTVEKILALRYRDATIQLSNGATFDVNQARLKLGDSYCVKWESVLK